MHRKELTEVEKLTVASYNILASEWAAAHSTKDFWRKELETLKRLLPQGRILEIGSGGGRDALILIETGYDYIGTDISEGLLRIARKNNPNLTFLNQSVYDLAFPINSFDGFWASAVLLHIPKNRISEALSGIYRVVRPNGVGFISVKQGNSEGISDGDEDFGDQFKRFFALYSEDEFSSHLIENNFNILETQVRSDSKRTTWLNFFVEAKK